MADGQFAALDTQADGARPGNLQALIRTRRGLLKAAATLAAVVLTSALAINYSPYWGWRLVQSPFLSSLDAWYWFACASCILWLPLSLLLLDQPDNMAIGPGWALPLATSSVLVVLASSAVVFASALAEPFTSPSGQVRPASILSSAPLAALFSFFAVALIARISNAALFARYAAEEYRSRKAAALRASVSGDAEVKEVLREVTLHEKEQGNAEALSALIGTVIVAAIIVLAQVAGSWNSETRIGRDVGLIIAAVILGIFAVVFSLDWLAELPPVRALSRWINGASHSFAWLADFYNFIDFLLVRIGAHVAGAGHTDPILRYAVLASTQACLAVMTWFLPDPLGLIPAFLGFTLALSVSRLWAWVEEDRNLAMITQFKPSAPRRIGFKEDFRDEAIFGFMFVLALIPMAMKQADAGHLFGVTYFQSADHHDPTPWFVYFCFELAKALPIVDWADIYLNPRNFDTLTPTHPWGQHATFVARTMVDLVLVAALLQAINITLRNRQQRTLYASRQINRLDEMVEREELRKALRRPKEEWFSRGLDFRHYDPERLRELHSNTDDERRKAFIDQIFEQRGDAVGYALEVLEKLAKRRALPADLHETFKTVQAEHYSNAHRIHSLDLEGVFDELRGVEGLRDLKIGLVDFAMEVGAVEEAGEPTDLAELLELVIFSSRRDQQKYTRIHAAKGLTRIVPRLLEPERVSSLLAQLKAARTEIFGRNLVVPEHLELALVERLREIGPPTRQ